MVQEVRYCLMCIFKSFVLWFRKLESTSCIHVCLLLMPYGHKIQTHERSKGMLIVYDNTKLELCDHFRFWNWQRKRWRNLHHVIFCCELLWPFAVPRCLFNISAWNMNQNVFVLVDYGGKYDCKSLTHNCTLIIISGAGESECVCDIQRSLPILLVSPHAERHLLPLQSYQAGQHVKKQDCLKYELYHCVLTFLHGLLD